MRKITAEELRRLRNEVPVELVFDELRLDSRWRGQRREFRCPQCCGMHVAIHERANLARCFRCEQNYNPIDLLMLVPGLRFLDAVRQLRRLATTTASRATSDETSRADTCLAPTGTELGEKPCGALIVE